VDAGRRDRDHGVARRDVEDVERVGGGAAGGTLAAREVGYVLRRREVWRASKEARRGNKGEVFISAR
jgi:hypothetical protein